MIEVFITDIQNKAQSDRISRTIQNENAELKINFDLNETELPFPCGHTILRVEGDKINSDKIIMAVKSQEFNCEILEDKVCTKNRTMTEFWEEAFKEKQEMWGWKPAKSTVLTKNFFVEHKVKTVLIPGIGYGRNAQIFRNNGMTVTGIEISETAIALGKKHFGNDLTIYHGSVTKMPFDNNLYCKLPQSSSI